METTLEEVQKIFANDLFATKRCGIRIESVSDEETVCVLDITPEHLNAAGTVMGGAIFTLADFTFAIAANAGKRLTVSLDSHINFLGVAKGTQLIARSHCIKSGHTTCFYRISIGDDLGNQVADVTVTGFIKS